MCEPLHIAGDLFYEASTQVSPVALYVIIRFITWSGRERPLMPHKRHSAETLLDDLVGNVEDARRDSEAERLGSVDGVNVSFGEPLDVEEG
jgi:hypothetical protein